MKLLSEAKSRKLILKQLAAFVPEVEQRRTGFDIVSWFKSRLNERQVALDRVKELQTEYDRMTGEKFSDRVHVALRAKFAQAQSRIEQLERQLASSQSAGGSGK